MKKRITLFSFLLIFFIAVLYANQNYFKSNTQLTNAKAEVKLLIDKHSLQDGDLIFQTSLSSQSKAIQLATKSKYSHCGLIYKEGNDFFVFEAVQPVKRTPLDAWIARGQSGKYVIKRLKNASDVITPSNDKIYCSELIWKIYKRATGIEIGNLQKLSDFDLTNEAVKKKMQERYGNKIPKGEIVISPAAIFDSELLVVVRAN